MSSVHTTHAYIRDCIHNLVYAWLTDINRHEILRRHSSLNSALRTHVAISLLCLPI